MKTEITLYVIEAIQNDLQIKALQKKLADLIQFQSPIYMLKTNGEFELLHSEEYSKLVANIIEQIEHRQSQIMSAYNY